MLREILALYEYNRWANDRFLDAAANLADDEFGRDLRSSFPSIRATLAHILEAEWIWLQRWLGVSPTDLPPDWGVTSYAALRERWQAFETEQWSFLTTLTDEALTRVLDYRNMAGTPFSNPLWEMMQHVANHSTYHRGQVATMLRQLGRPVPVSDLIAFYRERA